MTDDEPDFDALFSGLDDLQSTLNDEVTTARIAEATAVQELRIATAVATFELAELRGELGT